MVCIVAERQLVAFVETVGGGCKAVGHRIGSRM